MEMRTMKANGTLVPYVISGNGPLVILRHAMALQAWGDVSLLAESYTVVIPDWTDTDLYPAPNGDDWYHGLVAHLGFDKAALVVWSLAGPWGIRFAAKSSADLDRLVLCDTVGLAELDVGPGPLGSQGKPLPEAVREHFGRDAAAEPDSFEQLYLRMMNRPGEPERNYATEKRAAKPLTEYFPNILVPTLILSGSESDVLPPQVAQKVAGQMKDARVSVFEGCTHKLQLEQPARFQREVARFLGEAAATHPVNKGADRRAK